MQATDPYNNGLTTAGAPSRDELLGRMSEIEAGVAAEEFANIQALLADTNRSSDSLRDALSTRFMEEFRKTKSRTCFGLLYELNCHHLLIQVASRLRRYSSKADPRDVLQEVFFNVYRYPHRFNCEREDAFRVWSAMIVRNTVLKHLRTLGKGGRTEVPFEDLSDYAETGDVNPLNGVIETESRGECIRAYLTYLQLYLRFYGMLSERERRALQLVECEGQSYRNAAQELGIKLENLKMVIFRARKKIHRSMRRVFDGLSPDCRPARDPNACSHTSERSLDGSVDGAGIAGSGAGGQN